MFDVHRRATTPTPKRSQTVRLSVRKPFVYGLTWGNTDTKRQPFANRSPRDLPHDQSDHQATNATERDSRTHPYTSLHRPQLLMAAHRNLPWAPL